ncbi:MAG: TolC family protein [Bacteriovoracia bacterium]
MHSPASIAALKYDLESAYLEALKKTETLGLGNSRVIQATAREDQAWARNFPSINFIGSYQRQDTPDSIGTSGGFTKVNQGSARLNLLQPIYRGGRLSASYGVAKHQKESQEHTIETSKLDLYINVSRFYYDIKIAQKELDNLNNSISFTNDRIAELKKRTKIGRTRNGEVLMAQSQLAILQSQLKVAEGQLTVAKDQFGFATGLGSEFLLADEPEALPELDKLSSYLDLAEQRPDIQALKATIASNEENIRLARSGHFPSLDLSGNYYLLRIGSLQGVSWDTGVSLTFPIFSGGVVSSQVSEAIALQNESELQLSQLRRQIIANIKATYHNLESILEQVKTLELAYVATEKNYREQTRDYRFSLVSNLDVLQALNSFQDTKRALDRTRFQALALWATLKAQTGKLLGKNK